MDAIDTELPKVEQNEIKMENILGEGVKEEVEVLQDMKPFEIEPKTESIVEPKIEADLKQDTPCDENNEVKEDC
jgi:hypothetical protein